MIFRLHHTLVKNADMGIGYGIPDPVLHVYDSQVKLYEVGDKILATDNAISLYHMTELSWHKGGSPLD